MNYLTCFRFPARSAVVILNNESWYGWCRWNSLFSCHWLLERWLSLSLSCVFSTMYISLYMLSIDITRTKWLTFIHFSCLSDSHANILWSHVRWKQQKKTSRIYTARIRERLTGANTIIENITCRVLRLSLASSAFSISLRRIRAQTQTICTVHQYLRVIRVNTTYIPSTALINENCGWEAI